MTDEEKKVFAGMVVLVPVFYFCIEYAMTWAVFTLEASL